MMLFMLIQLYRLSLQSYCFMYDDYCLKNNIIAVLLNSYICRYVFSFSVCSQSQQIISVNIYQVLKIHLVMYSHSTT